MRSPYRYQTPDSRIRRIQYARDREDERAARLDEQDNQRLNTIREQMEAEQARGADLDRQDSIAEQMRIEQTRSRDLDRRDRERTTPAFTPTPTPTPARPSIVPVGAPPGQGAVSPPSREPGLLRRGLGLLERGVGEAYQAVRERPMLGGPFAEPAGGGPTMLEEFATRYQDPSAALLAQAWKYDPVERWLAEQAPTKTPFGRELGEREPRFGAGQVMEEGERWVNPIKAVWGDEEEQQRAQEVLAELDLLPSLAARGLADITLLLPGVGITKIDDFVSGVRAVSRLTGKARTAAVSRLSGNPVAQSLRHTEEIQDPIKRLADIIKRQKPLRAEAEIAKSESLRGKVAEIRRIRERYSGEEAFRRETAALRGPDLPYRAEEGLRAEFSQLEIDSMIDHVLKHPAAEARPLEARNARAALVDTLGGKLPTEGEIALLERYFGKELAKAVATNRPLGSKAWTAFVDVMNLPRTLMASMDVSFPFRQGIMVAPRHPKEWLGNLPNMFRGGFSSRHARLLDEAMSADATIIQTTKGPRALSELAADSGLYRAPIGGFGPLMEREEFFLSNLAKRLPLIGRGVRFSERAFVTYGNKLRQDIFKNTLQSWTKGEKAVTLEDTKALANLLNRMTGRGTLGPANQYAPLLSAGFFAPRFALSRPQAFMQLFNYRNPRVAYLAAQEIVSFVALGTSALSLLKLSGATDVELDPRSADFGKVKIGNTRIDFWGGNLQWARLVTQLQQQKRKTSTGVVVPAGGIDAAVRFLRFKGSPPAAVGVDWLLAGGETAIGQKFPPTELGLAGEGDITTEVFRRTGPMAIQDLVEAILEHDATGGFLGSLAFGGMGVQTYETRAQAFERVTGKSYDETPPKLRQQIIRETPELQRFEPEEPTESELIRMSTTEKLLPLAQAVLQGTPGAARNYHENRPNIMSAGAGAAEWVFRDLDIKPVGRDNEILNEYYAVDFLADLDGNGIPGDDEDVRMALEEQDKLKEQLSPDVREAMDNPENFFPDEDVIAVEERRDLAVDRVRHLVENIPKYSKETAEGSEKIDDFVRYTRQQQDEGIHEHGEERWGWSLPKLAIELGKERDDPELGQAASWALSRNIKWNDEYNDYLIENQEVIAPFFPRMYQRVIFRASGVLSDEIWKEVNLPLQPPGVPPMPEAMAAFRS